MAAITGAAALLRAGGQAFEVVKVLGVTYLLTMAHGAGGAEWAGADRHGVPLRLLRA